MFNDTLPMAVSCDTAPAAVRAAPVFYVVSRKKLATLFLATFGMYAMYWFYKNWSNYKKHSLATGSDEVRSIWPVPRGFFSVFFTHSLFRKVKAHGRDNATIAAWGDRWHAWSVVGYTLGSDALNRMSNKSPEFGWVDILSFAILLPWLVKMLQAQDMINLACADPAGDGNRRFTKVNYLWIGLGVLFWSVIVVGAVLARWYPESLDEPPAAVDQSTVTTSHGLSTPADLLSARQRIC